MKKSINTEVLEQHLQFLPHAEFVRGQLNGAGHKISQLASRCVS